MKSNPVYRKILFTTFASYSHQSRGNTDTINVGGNLTNLWQKTSRHSFLRHGVYIYI